MEDLDCIFCKIVKGEIPSSTVYEDDLFKGILDVSPASDGHVLVVSKQHYANLMELPDEIVARGFIVAKKIAKALEQLLSCDGINIVQNNRAAAGQTVFHFHIHVITRTKGDKLGLTWKPGKLADKVRDQIMCGIQISN